MRNYLKYLSILFTLLTSIVYADQANVHVIEQPLTVHTINYTNKWVILNYWAIWCENCKKEIPELNKFHAAHPEILLLGVDYGITDLKQLQHEYKQAHLRYPLLTDEIPEQWHVPGIAAIPMTFIINPNNQIVKIINGPTTTQELTTTMQSLENAK